MWKKGTPRKGKARGRIAVPATVFQEAVVLAVLAALTGLCLAMAGCVITWEYLDINCSVAENQDFFSEECIILKFSQTPDRESAEEQLQFQAAGRAANIITQWEGRSLSLRPEIPWQKGQFYSLSLEGNLKMDDGRSYTTRLYRSFCYGDADTEFTLLSSTLEGESLVYVFSQPVLISSFHEKYTMSPYIERHTDFSDDHRTVRVTPKNGWQANTGYRWTIDGMVSASGYLMKKEYSGTHGGIRDTVLPVLETVCPVSYDPPYTQWHTGLELDGSIMEWQSVGFIFSKPMDPATVRSGISFTPSISGYYIQEDDRRFIFVPEEHFQLKKEYRLSVTATVSDSSGISLFKESTVFFTGANDYLTVESVSFDDTDTALSTDGTIHEYAISASGRLKTVIDFSTLIPADKRNGAVDSVSFTALFPAEASNPSLVSAFWTEPGYRLTLGWEGFSASTAGVPKYYILTIKGGSGGITNGLGEYLKEDVCVIFKVL